MYGDFNNYGRRPSGRNIQAEFARLQQAYQQAQAEAAAWKKEAERLQAEVNKWQRAAQQESQEKTTAYQIQKRAETALVKTQQELAETQETLKNLAANQETEPPAAEENDWKEQYIRLAADFENTKKRLEQRYANASRQEKEKILRDMLPLADNLERVLQHTQNEQDKEGIELTLKAFRDVLNRYGVQPIQAEGQPFDPEYHEAIGTLPNADVPEDTVTAVEQTGYTLDGKLLRPSRVLVSR